MRKRELAGNIGSAFGQDMSFYSQGALRWERQGIAVVFPELGFIFLRNKLVESWGYRARVVRQFAISVMRHDEKRAGDYLTTMLVRHVGSNILMKPAFL